MVLLLRERGQDLLQLLRFLACRADLSSQLVASLWVGLMSDSHIAVILDTRHHFCAVIWVLQKYQINSKIKIQSSMLYRMTGSTADNFIRTPAPAAVSQPCNMATGCSLSLQTEGLQGLVHCCPPLRSLLADQECGRWCEGINYILILNP